jgi:flagellar basal-body rod modification protein FlgD
MAVTDITGVEHNAFVQSIINASAAREGSRNTDELGKEQFLSLLVLQLRYQDPLNPMDNREFIAQIAQFSALEQMQNMNASQSAAKGFAMIGKYVTATLKDEVTGANRIVEGHVESVVMSGSRVFLTVAGMQIPIDNVSVVADGFNPLSSSLSAYTGLIGCNVKAAVYDIATGEIVGVSGEVASLAKGTYEDYAILNGVAAKAIGVNKDGVLVEDRARLIECLEVAASKDKPEDRHVEIFVQDANGKRVPIGATLKSFSVLPDGTVTVELDDVAAPLSSIAVITKPKSADKPGEGGPGEGSSVENGSGEEGSGINGSDETGGDAP